MGVAREWSNVQILAEESLGAGSASASDHMLGVSVPPGGLMSHHCRQGLPLCFGVLLIALGCSPTGVPGELVTQNIRCLIDTSSSRTILRADTQITLEQPDLFLYAVDSKGETYASTVSGGALLHWSPDGTLLPMIGSPGEGPGQFANGPVIPFVTAEDSIYARDNHRHWVVFGPDGEFVRFSPLGPISGSALGTTSFAEAGAVLSSDQSGVEPYSLLLVDREGVILQRVRLLERSVLAWSPRRAAVQASSGTFWVGPEIYARGGYSVELWDSAGNTLRLLRRVVPWFVADSLSHPVDRDAPPGSPTDPLSRPFLFPRVETLAKDRKGRLWVVTQVPRTSRSRDRILRTRNLADLYAASLEELEVHVEVLEPESAEVIASAVFRYGFHLLAGARDGILVRQDTTTGLRTPIRYGLRLIDSAGNECS